MLTANILAKFLTQKCLYFAKFLYVLVFLHSIAGWAWLPVFVQFVYLTVYLLN